MVRNHVKRIRRRYGSHGSVEGIVGCMFSGKTDELIRRLRLAQIAGETVLAFKPRIDNRYTVRWIASHTGGRFKAHPVSSVAQILSIVTIEKPTVVGIDEIQFLGEGASVLVQELASRSIRVIFAGLNLDFRSEPFGPMTSLMPQADQLEMMTAICSVCGGDATRSQRLINGHPARYNDPVVKVGAAELYEARCRRHHKVPGKSQRDYRKAPKGLPKSPDAGLDSSRRE